MSATRVFALQRADGSVWSQSASQLGDRDYCWVKTPGWRTAPCTWATAKAALAAARGHKDQRDSRIKVVEILPDGDLIETTETPGQGAG